MSSFLSRLKQRASAQLQKRKTKNIRKKALSLSGLRPITSQIYSLHSNRFDGLFHFLDDYHHNNYVIISLGCFLDSFIPLEFPQLRLKINRCSIRIPGPVLDPIHLLRACEAVRRWIRPAPYAPQHRLALRNDGSVLPQTVSGSAVVVIAAPPVVLPFVCAAVLVYVHTHHTFWGSGLPRTALFSNSGLEAALSGDECKSQSEPGSDAVRRTINLMTEIADMDGAGEGDTCHRVHCEKGGPCVCHGAFSRPSLRDRVNVSLSCPCQEDQKLWQKTALRLGTEKRAVKTSTETNDCVHARPSGTQRACDVASNYIGAVNDSDNGNDSSTAEMHCTDLRWPDGEIISPVNKVTVASAYTYVLAKWKAAGSVKTIWTSFQLRDPTRRNSDNGEDGSVAKKRSFWQRMLGRGRSQSMSASQRLSSATTEAKEQLVLPETATSVFKKYPMLHGAGCPVSLLWYSRWLVQGGCMLGAQVLCHHFWDMFDAASVKVSPESISLQEMLCAPPVVLYPPRMCLQKTTLGCVPAPRPPRPPLCTWRAHSPSMEGVRRLIGICVSGRRFVFNSVQHADGEQRVEFPGGLWSGSGGESYGEYVPGPMERFLAAHHRAEASSDGGEGDAKSSDGGMLTNAMEPGHVSVLDYPVFHSLPYSVGVGWNGQGCSVCGVALMPYKHDYNGLNRRRGGDPDCPEAGWYQKKSSIKLHWDTLRSLNVKDYVEKNFVLPSREVVQGNSVFGEAENAQQRRGSGRLANSRHSGDCSRRCRGCERSLLPLRANGMRSLEVMSEMTARLLHSYHLDLSSMCNHSVTFGFLLSSLREQGCDAGSLVGSRKKSTIETGDFVVEGLNYMLAIREYMGKSAGGSDVLDWIAALLARQPIPSEPAAKHNEDGKQDDSEVGTGGRGNMSVTSPIPATPVPLPAGECPAVPFRMLLKFLSDYGPGLVDLTPSFAERYQQCTQAEDIAKEPAMAMDFTAEDSSAAPPGPPPAPPSSVCGQRLVSYVNHTNRLLQPRRGDNRTHSSRRLSYMTTNGRGGSPVRRIVVPAYISREFVYRHSTPGISLISSLDCDEDSETEDEEVLGLTESEAKAARLAMTTTASSSPGLPKQKCAAVARQAEFLQLCRSIGLKAPSQRLRKFCDKMSEVLGASKHGKYLSLHDTTPLSSTDGLGVRLGFRSLERSDVQSGSWTTSISGDQGVSEWRQQSRVLAWQRALRRPLQQLQLPERSEDEAKTDGAQTEYGAPARPYGLPRMLSQVVGHYELLHVLTRQHRDLVRTSRNGPVQEESKLRDTLSSEEKGDELPAVLVSELDLLPSGLQAGVLSYSPTLQYSAGPRESNDTQFLTVPAFEHSKIFEWCFSPRILHDKIVSLHAYTPSYNLKLYDMPERTNTDDPRKTLCHIGFSLSLSWLAAASNPNSYLSTSPDNRAAFTGNDPSQATLHANKSSENCDSNGCVKCRSHRSYARRARQVYERIKTTARSSKSCDDKPDAATEDDEQKDSASAQEASKDILPHLFPSHQLDECGMVSLVVPVFPQQMGTLCSDWRNAAHNSMLNARVISKIRKRRFAEWDKAYGKMRTSFQKAHGYQPSHIGCRHFDSAPNLGRTTMATNDETEPVPPATPAASPLCAEAESSPVEHVSTPSLDAVRIPDVPLETVGELEDPFHIETALAQPSSVVLHPTTALGTTEADEPTGKRREDSPFMEPLSLNTTPGTGVSEPKIEAAVEVVVSKQNDASTSTAEPSPASRDIAHVENDPFDGLVHDVADPFDADGPQDSPAESDTASHDLSALTNPTFSTPADPLSSETIEHRAGDETSVGDGVENGDPDMSDGRMRSDSSGDQEPEVSHEKANEAHNDEHEADKQREDTDEDDIDYQRQAQEFLDSVGGAPELGDVETSSAVPVGSMPSSSLVASLDLTDPASSPSMLRRSHDLQPYASPSDVLDSDSEEPKDWDRMAVAVVQEAFASDWNSASEEEEEDEVASSSEDGSYILTKPGEDTETSDAESSGFSDCGASSPPANPPTPPNATVSSSIAAGLQSSAWVGRLPRWQDLRLLPPPSLLRPHYVSADQTVGQRTCTGATDAESSRALYYSVTAFPWHNRQRAHLWTHTTSVSVQFPKLDHQNTETRTDDAASASPPPPPPRPHPSFEDVGLSDSESSYYGTVYDEDHPVGSAQSGGNVGREDYGLSGQYLGSSSQRMNTDWAYELEQDGLAYSLAQHNASSNSSNAYLTRRSAAALYGGVYGTTSNRPVGVNPYGSLYRRSGTETLSRAHLRNHSNNTQERLRSFFSVTNSGRQSTSTRPSATNSLWLVAPVPQQQTQELDRMYERRRRSTERLVRTLSRMTQDNDSDRNRRAYNLRLALRDRHREQMLQQSLERNGFHVMETSTLRSGSLLRTLQAQTLEEGQQVAPQELLKSHSKRRRHTIVHAADEAAPLVFLHFACSPEELGWRTLQLLRELPGATDEAMKVPGSSSDTVLTEDTDKTQLLCEHHRLHCVAGRFRAGNQAVTALAKSCWKCAVARPAKIGDSLQSNRPNSMDASFIGIDGGPSFLEDVVDSSWSDAESEGSDVQSTPSTTQRVVDVDEKEDVAAVVYEDANMRVEVKNHASPVSDQNVTDPFAQVTSGESRQTVGDGEPYINTGGAQSSARWYSSSGPSNGSDAPQDPSQPPQYPHRMTRAEDSGSSGQPNTEEERQLGGVSRSALSPPPPLPPQTTEAQSSPSFGSNMASALRESSSERQESGRRQGAQQQVMQSTGSLYHDMLIMQSMFNIDQMSAREIQAWIDSQSQPSAGSSAQSSGRSPSRRSSRHRSRRRNRRGTTRTERSPSSTTASTAQAPALPPTQPETRSSEPATGSSRRTRTDSRTRGGTGSRQRNRSSTTSRRTSTGNSSRSGRRSTRDSSAENQAPASTSPPATTSTAPSTEPPRSPPATSTSTPNPELSPEVAGSVSSLHNAFLSRHGSGSGGASANLISVFPVFECKAGSKYVSEDCMICQMRFEEGDALRLLPCIHAYHKNCLDRWLLIKATCPMCMRRVDSMLQ